MHISYTVAIWASLSSYWKNSIGLLILACTSEPFLTFLTLTDLNAIQILYNFALGLYRPFHKM